MNRALIPKYSRIIGAVLCCGYGLCSKDKQTEMSGRPLGKKISIVRRAAPMSRAHCTAAKTGRIIQRLSCRILSLFYYSKAKMNDLGTLQCHLKVQQFSWNVSTKTKHNTRNT